MDVLRVLFSSAAARVRHSSGIWAEERARFAASYLERGYLVDTTAKLMIGARHVAVWAEKSRKAATGADAAQLREGYKRHLQRCRCSSGYNMPRADTSRQAFRSGMAFIRYLADQGVVAPAPRARVPPLLAEYATYMGEQRGLASATITLRCSHVRRLLTACGEEPHAYDAKAIRRFVTEQAQGKSQGYIQSLLGATRSYLRFLTVRGVISAPLAGAVPSLASWRLQSVPRHLASEDVERLIEACDPSTAKGSRDRAILLLFWKLGLRLSDARTLRLADVDWRAAAIRLHGKGLKESRLPLPQDVGDALLHYLKRYRPSSARTDAFFLTTLGVPRAMTSGCVGGAVRARYIQAGVVGPTRGAHALRHSAARRLLAEGSSLEQVRDILRHSVMDTTLLYAKVDFESLSEVAQPWPRLPEARTP